MTKKHMVWIGLLLIVAGLGLHYYGTTTSGAGGTFSTPNTKGILDGLAGAGVGLLAAAYF